MRLGEYQRIHVVLRPVVPAPCRKYRKWVTNVILYLRTCPCLAPERASIWSKQRSPHSACGWDKMADFLQKIWPSEEGQDIAEYAIILAVILAPAIGTVRAIGVSANTVFSGIGSSVQWFIS